MLYWAMEYSKVLIAYIALMYIWPSVVFRRYLAPKSRTFRFAFCTTVQVIIVNTVVLLLGLAHILNRWTMIFVFYGIFLYSVFREKHFTGQGIQKFRQVLVGTRGVKLFFAQTLWGIGARVRYGFRWILGKTKGQRMEYLTLTVLLLYGMIYFSYGAFVDRSYGFGDMYTHHSWIYGLLEGKVFSAGIYPEAMHCFIYAMHQLFGIRVYSCMLFVAGVHVATLLVAVYCFFKEVFCSRYTGLLAIAAFLTLDSVCVDEIFSMARLQWTLPQEFALYTQFLCALYLVRYLRTDRNPRKESGKRRFIVWDENLFAFLLALAASLAIHFYVTIMAFFLCAAFAIPLWYRIFRRGNFRSLVAAVMAGVLLAVAPMGLAYATGIRFQGSIGWALNVISGEDTKEGRSQLAEETIGAEDTQMDQQPSMDTQQVESTQEFHGATSSGQHQNTSVVPVKQSLMQRIQKIRIRVSQIVEKKAADVYTYGYVTLYSDERALWIVRFTGLTAIMGMVLSLISIVFRRKTFFGGYFGIMLATVFFMILYAAPFLRLPELIAGSRLCSTEQLLIIAMMLIPIDFVFYLLGKMIFRILLPAVSAILAGAIYVGTNYFDVYHGYLYNELTRYHSAVEVTNEIIGHYPQQSYTVVSTTDELYQLVEFGWHEEAINFLRQIQRGSYTLPSQYLFFYVEKRPIQYAQSHFFTGPRWLAQEKYTQYYSEYFSEGDRINQTTISDAYARRQLMYFSKESMIYTDLTSRTILESRLYKWCEGFRESFPHEMKVYYEDDNFVCYVIRQNPYRLFSLEES